MVAYLNRKDWYHDIREEKIEDDLKGAYFGFQAFIDFSFLAVAHKKAD